MLQESLLNELSKQAERGRSCRPVKYVEVDPRVLGQLIEEIELLRQVLLISEKTKKPEPALRD